MGFDEPKGLRILFFLPRGLFPFHLLGASVAFSTVLPLDSSMVHQGSHWEVMGHCPPAPAQSQTHRPEAVLSLVLETCPSGSFSLCILGVLGQLQVQIVIL